MCIPKFNGVVNNLTSYFKFLISPPPQVKDTQINNNGIEPFTPRLNV